MKASIKDEVLGYIVKEMRERLGTHFKKIILFGSRARGDKTAESDYDCLVVVNELPGMMSQVQTGVISLFHREFVKTAIISPEVAKFLDIAFRRGELLSAGFSGAPTFRYSSARLQFVKI